jgi:hypothetical protein
MDGHGLIRCSFYLTENVFYDICTQVHVKTRAWGDIVVKALRYYLEGPGIDPLSLGIFSGASDSSMCPGVDSAYKNEYQDIPGGKDGLCVRVTTLPPSCAECLEILEP